MARLLSPVSGLLAIGACYFGIAPPVIALATLAVLLLSPVIVPLALAHEGRMRGWSATMMRRGSIAFVVLWLAGMGGLIGTTTYKIRNASKLKNLIPHLFLAAAGVDRHELGREESTRPLLVLAKPA